MTKRATDPFQSIDQLDPPAIERVVERLEFRARDPTFTGWRDAYLDRLELRNAETLLDVGCGTGVVARAVALRQDFSGKIVAIDPSVALLAAAQRFADIEQIGSSIEFRLGDAIHLEFAEGTFDRVIAHTTLSHVTDPASMVHELARVLAPGGMLTIFDGDYASWTFDHPDAELAESMEQAVIDSVVANPRIMRSLPRLFQGSGLELLEMQAWIYVDAGPGGFFKSAFETYGPWTVRSGNASAQDYERWADYLRDAMASNVFFCACNYYAVIARRG